MLYDYITKNYDNDEPIFLSELPGNSIDYVRQEMKQLSDSGKIKRLHNGVYYLSYTTILGDVGKVSIKKYVEKRYLVNKGKTIGYLIGLGLANKYGFTTQNASCIEICSNNATTKQRKLVIDGWTIIVYKPLAEVTDKNVSTLQLLDLMSSIDKYNELSSKELKKKLKSFVSNNRIDYELVKQYLPLFPDRTYRNFYDGGLMDELVQAKRK